MSRGRTLVVVAGLMVGLMAGLAGCGIPTDGEPRPLADEAPTTATGGVDPDNGGATAVVYLVVGATTQLEERTRSLDGEKTPKTVLDALLLPPSDAEAEDGLDSYIPQDTRALGVETTDGIAVADMSGEWERLSDPIGTTAYAQVVLTLTELQEVDRVRFLIEGEAIPAPTVNRGPQDVVTADDYANLDPG